MSIFLAGAGALSASEPGKDGNPKCPPEARVFSLQVVDQLLGDKNRYDSSSSLLPFRLQLKDISAALL